MASIQFLNPDSMGKPIAPYSNIARVKASEFLFIAGQIGADRDGKVAADFEGQCAQVFANIGAALASQGAGFANIVEFTTYLVHSQDIAKFAQYRPHGRRVDRYADLGRVGRRGEGARCDSGGENESGMAHVHDDLR